MKEPHFTCTMLAKNKARIEIYDEIGPAWYGMIDEKTVAQALKDAGDVTEIELRVNSLGGDAYDGLAIGNILKAHPAKVHGHVEGIAASAATLLMMGCDTITVPKNALFMVHDPSTFCYGGVDDMKRAIEQLESCTRAGIEAYAAKNTKKSKEEIAVLLKAETWMTGEEAVEAGFADKTDAEVQVPKVEPKAVAQSRFKNAPSQFASLLAISMRAKPEETEMAEVTNVKPEVETPVVPKVEQAVPVVVTPVVEAAKPVLTEADVKAAADAAVKSAIEGERNRANDITALCSKAGCPDKASDFIGKGSAVQEVQQQLFEVLCTTRKPSDEGGSGTPIPKAVDENAKYKAEYAKDKAQYVKDGLTEDAYVQMRRVDDGIDALSMNPKVA